MDDSRTTQGYSGGGRGGGGRWNDALYNSNFEFSSKDMDEMMEERRKREAAATSTNINTMIGIPPPLPILPQRQSVGDPLISTGLNMYFKKIDGFSQDSISGGGPLNPPQPKDSKLLAKLESDVVQAKVQSIQLQP